MEAVGAGRASVPVSPDFLEGRPESGLAGTLAVPGFDELHLLDAPVELGVGVFAAREGITLAGQRNL